MLSNSLKDNIKKHGFYSSMQMCPLAYHGYRKTKENINEIIEEIEYEISVYPNEADHLLDMINNLNKINPEPQ